MSGFNYIIASISWSSARGSLTQYIYFVQVNHLEGLQSFFLQTHELKSDKDRIVIDIVHSLAIKIYHVTLMEAQHGSFFSVPALIMVYMTKYIDWGPHYTTIKQGKTQMSIWAYLWICSIPKNDWEGDKSFFLLQATYLCLIELFFHQFM